MSVLNRIPRGMLDLFGSITQGKNPPQYVDMVSPVVDIGDLYLGDKLACYAIDAISGGIGNTFAMTQGTSETWLLRGLSVNVLLIPGGSFQRWQVGLQRPPLFAENNAVAGAAPLIWTSNLLDPVSTAGGGSDAIVFDEPIVMHPGVGLVWRIIDRVGAGAETTELRAMMSILSS